MKFESAPQDEVMEDDERVSSEQLELIRTEFESFKSTPEVRGNVSSYLLFIKKYWEKHIDLETEYKSRPITSSRDAVKDDFLNSKEHGPFAQFAEYLPLLANKEGRLGRICRAKITKTAKPDDEGNGFIDLVCELSIDREYLRNNPGLSKIRPTITFGVDVTTNPAKHDEKMNALKVSNLSQGKKASVLCYENAHHVLGLEVPKCIISEREAYLAQIAEQLRGAMTTTPDDTLMITDDERFDARYQQFFSDFVKASADNIEVCIGVLSNQERSSTEQRDLQCSYQDILDFLHTYRKILAANE